MDTSQAASKKVGYPTWKGAAVAESLGFGLVRVLGRTPLHDHLAKTLYATRRYLNDVISWEEALPFLQITAETMHEDCEECMPLPRCPKGHP